MFLTLQTNMEMLQIENKRLYQENILLKSGKNSTTNQEPGNPERDSGETFTPTATTDDGVESNSENSNCKEEDQVKFLKSKLQVRDIRSIIKRMNKTLRILVQFNRDMADEIASFKNNEEILINYMKKVDDLEEKYEKKIDDMKENYENRIQRLEEFILNSNGNEQNNENFIHSISAEKEFWKQQALKYNIRGQNRTFENQELSPQNHFNKVI